MDPLYSNPLREAFSDMILAHRFSFGSGNLAREVTCDRVLFEGWQPGCRTTPLATG